MRFDWIKFLDRHGIVYVTAGPNTAKGNVNIHCPFCGSADTSEHLGVSLHGKGWACWRNQAEHSGIRPHRLVQALLGCSYIEAARIVGDDGDIIPSVDDRKFGDVIGKMMRPQHETKAETRVTSLAFPTHMFPITSQSTAASVFRRYIMVDRKFTFDEVYDLADLYDLRGATIGAFRYRIIFPIVHPEGLVSWQGRTIANSTLRYKALSADAEKAKEEGMPVARLSIDRCLWQAGPLMDAKGHSLVLCEGPFDALRLDYYGRQFGLRATCLFRKHLSDDQLELLHDVAFNFKHRYLMLDSDAVISAYKMIPRLEALGFEIRQLPKGVKDPGELTPIQIRNLFS